MNIDCPQCHDRDQVRSVRAVYEAQSGTYSGVATGITSGVGFSPGVGAVPVVGRSTFRTSGSSSTLLADNLAPPAYPTLVKPRGGCLLALLASAPVVAAVLALPLLISHQAHAVRNAVVFWCAVSLPFMAVAAVLLGLRVRTYLRNKRAFHTYSAVYPSLMTVWNAGFVCIRCHLAFLAAGPPGAGSARVAPVPQFQQMVAVLAAEQRNHPPMATAPLT